MIFMIFIQSGRANLDVITHSFNVIIIVIFGADAVIHPLLNRIYCYIYMCNLEIVFCFQTQTPCIQMFRCNCIWEARKWKLKSKKNKKTRKRASADPDANRYTKFKFVFTRSFVWFAFPGRHIYGINSGCFAQNMCVCALHIVEARDFQSLFLFRSLSHFGVLADWHIYYFLFLFSLELIHINFMLVSRFQHTRIYTAILNYLWMFLNFKTETLWGRLLCVSTFFG